MKVLIVGGGGREHALAWKVAQSAQVEQVFVAPGNAGTETEASVSNVAIAADDIAALIEFAEQNTIDLTIVGPEAPLVAGIVDQFQQRHLRCFGPSAAAAQLEGSKSFCKDFLQRHHIPTAAYRVFNDEAEAAHYIQTLPRPPVIKADGLAAGKGVVVAQSHDEAIEAVHQMLAGNQFGKAGIASSSRNFSSARRQALLSCVMEKPSCHWPVRRITRRVIMVTADRTPAEWVPTHRHR